MNRFQIHTKNFAIAFISIMILIVTATSCKYEQADPLTEVASCEGCHTNYDHLKAVHSPDTVVTGGGCGGDAPHFEPYDRVYMGGEGYDQFVASSHYGIGCVGCHNGNDNTSDKSVAHSGDFLAHPSSDYQNKCGTCHSDIANDFLTSIHNGTGQKRKVTVRSGLSGPDDFDLLPAHQIEGYNQNCATCHGTCGNCHIVRPSAGGGGLVNGHSFEKTPNWRNVCVTCHTSRGGHAYLGVASGTVPDAHLTNNGYTCYDCHNGAELHGDGEPVDQRYAYDKLPSCDDCHTGIETINSYHSVHYTDFNCHVCHSQDYNSCGSCHVHGDGARITSHQDFKIALNTIPDIKTEYRLALVRRNPAAPDNWDVYDVSEYANFDAFPTYNYTTPHNILRWTNRTEVSKDKACWSSCHIYEEEGSFVNKDLYLFFEDLETWEQTATGPYTVDGELPAGWGVN